MRNVIRIAAILGTIAVVFFAALSKTTTGAEQKPTGAPSATIHFEEWHVMAMLGGDWGHGTLGYNGKTYKFKATGLGAGGVGVEKISATGEVYHLKDIADFAGKYSELRAGVDVGKGAGDYYIRNDNGVVINLKTHGEGVAFSIGVQGLTIQMVDEK